MSHSIEQGVYMSTLSIRRLVNGNHTLGAQITKRGILKHARAVVGDMEEKDVFTSSFDERTRFSAMKEVRETGSRRSLIVLQEIEHSEMALGEVSQLERLNVSCFFRRNACLLTGKNSFAILSSV